MSNLFDQPAAPEPAKTAVQQLFVDEAGTPTLFHESGKLIVDTFGCSRFFILGKLEVENPVALVSQLTALRQQMLADPMFAGTESFKPERKKTAVAEKEKTVSIGTPKVLTARGRILLTVKIPSNISWKL